MPVIIALIVRQVIMAVATGAVVTFAQNLIDGTFRELVNEIRSENGLSEEEAKDIFLNVLVDLAINSATIAAVLRTKLAVRTAEWLGLSSRGLVKRKLTPKAAAAAAKGAGQLDKKKSLGLIAQIFKRVGNPVALFWLFLGFTQFVEQGVYQAKTANDQYERFLGFRPFAEKGFSLAPANFKADTFAGYAQSLETAGVRGFSDPVNRQSRLYSREDLAAIIDWVYGKAVLEGKVFSDWRGVVPLVTPYLIGGTTTPSSSSAPANISPSTTASSGTKVFTGIVSQGTVGAGLNFTPRPDDLIESAQELQEAINNNVAPYLASLLNKVTYEIKVVSSIVVNGLSLRGQSQRVQSGTYANGTPKYKTVVNKFAVATLYLITDRGTRSKLTSIVLGPVNALTFQPTAADLATVSAAVSKSFITNSTDGISTVVSNTPTADVRRGEIQSSEPARVIVPEAPVVQTTQRAVRLPPLSVPVETWMAPRTGRPAALAEKTTYKSLLSVGNDLLGVLNAVENDINSGRVGSLHTSLLTWFSDLSDEEKEAIRKGRTSYADESPPVGGQAVELTPTQSNNASANSLPPAALAASTLSEFYSAEGEALPSLSERADLYQARGLGQSAFYVGNAEQNTKLLRSLQGRPL